MKNLKRILLVLLLLVMVVPFNTISAKEKVKVYIFRGEGCPHCEEALEFFDKLGKRDKYNVMYDLKKYEVWYDKDNAKLMENVAKELGTEASGVPFIVIGKKSFSGYSSNSDSQIKQAIKDAYESDDYVDVVAKVKGELKESKSDFPVVGITITIASAVLIIVGLVVLTKRL